MKFLDFFRNQQLDRIELKLDETLWRLNEMAISQDQFDTDLKALTDSITALIAAIEAAIAARPAADFTAEDAAVQDAAAAVAAEITKITP